MTNLSEMGKDRFFVLKKNTSIDEFYTLEDALETSEKEFIVIDRFKEFFTPPSGFSWRISEFIFVTNNQEPYKILNAGWTIHSIDTVYKSSSKINFNVIISDPTKKIKRIFHESNIARSHENLSAHDIHIIQIALQKLYERSIYQSWEQFDLLEENNQLKKQIVALNIEISKLNDEIKKKM